LAAGENDRQSRQFKHAVKSGLVTVAGKPSLDVPPGTLKSILKQAGLRS
jgi:predicted RNA binding protein YcfA (HicA-like mRNA interferase family)